MAEFQPNKLDTDNLNYGKKYTVADGVSPDSFNRIIEGIDYLNKKTIVSDTEFSYTSENPVQNKVITNAIVPLQNKVDSLYGAYVKFSTEEQVAYQKDIPANSLRNTMLDKIGGITHKCKNLWTTDIQYPAYYGRVLYDAETQIYTINATGVICSVYKFKTPLPVNTKYSLTIELFQGGISKGYGFAIGTQYRGETNQWGVILDIPKQDNYAGKTYTVTQTPDIACTDLMIYCDASNIFTEDIKFRVMLNYEEPEPYEPYYSGLYNATPTAMKINGANLIDKNNVDKKSNWDTNITPQRGYDYYEIKLHPNSTYIFSRKDNSVAKSGNVYANLSGYSARGTDRGAFIIHPSSGLCKKTATVTTDDTGLLYLNLYQSNSYLQEFIETCGYLMLNKGSTALPYTPYIPPTEIDLAQLSTLKDYGVGVEYEGKYYSNFFKPETHEYIRQCVKIKPETVTAVGNVEGNDYGAFQIRIDGELKSALSQNALISSHFEVGYGKTQDGYCYIADPQTDDIYFYKDGFKTQSDWENWFAEQKASGNPVEFDVILKEPIIEKHPEINIDDIIKTEPYGTITFENEKQKPAYSQLTFEIKNI